MSGDVRARITTESSLSTHHVATPPERVWAELPSIFEEMGIPIDTWEPEAMIVGNASLSPTRLDGERMSHFLVCGSGVTGRPYADAYQVTMYLMTRVDSTAPDDTRIRTEIYATAKARDTSGYRLQCSSRGTLERRIWEKVLERVGGTLPRATRSHGWLTP